MKILYKHLKEKNDDGKPLSWRRLLGRAAVCAAALSLTVVMPAAASSEVTAKINNIKDLVVNIIAAVGGIVLAFGVFEFASAYQSHDSSQMTQSLKKVVSGLLMVMIQVVLKLIG